MHCCTGNGARALYYAWERILDHRDGRLRVNLLLNRASPWADVDSHVPYEGRVDVKVKLPVDLSIRIPEWVKPGEATLRVAPAGAPVDAGAARQPGWDGRYARFGAVRPGETAALSFPIAERIERNVPIADRHYTLAIRGNTVVAIDPPGTLCPLYQRGHYREARTRWRRTRRFVSDIVLKF
jgi:DUF1680 family protein